MNLSFEDAPARSHMDDDLIKWRCNKPNYEVVNKLYLKERSKTHKPNSVEKKIENLMKTFEMELTNKKNPKEWKSVAYDVFKMQINGGKYFSADELADVGSYNVLLADAPLYKTTDEKQEILHGQYKEAFPGGFAWEVLEVISGPPVVTFTWRHWARWTGPFKGVSPSGERVEMKGCAIATVNENLQVEELKVYYDPNPILATLLKLNTGTDEGATRCPFHKSMK
ncbi:pathogen-related protein-like [Lingula anatina]|uniref:Pathogen-related protein-like n=1 Tax=Lingula anatina TaxID=7574 RepID=A0A1S3HZG8_LINAN|nr:pathogen-related protein-like [Lingula anatina]|eukprot:XP_013390484.1 pathogen-related protein-like [Lingula anatina]